eukprot:8145646-Ditylum_brightwellii.AAC.2
MESSIQGFIAQLKGALTKRCYHISTIFVDHFPRYTYIHMQHNLTSEETVQAKKAFEAHLRKHSIEVQHYHADNEKFTYNAFINTAATAGQTISYCSVNAHFQNGIAEKQI